VSSGTEPLVLVVDDNEKNMKLARDVLRLGGLQTLEATTGGESISLAAEHLPDVILMDIRLPDMDGTDAARRLADGARTSAIPVVAFSSLALDGDAPWLLDAGFAGSLEKPIDVQDLPDQVRRYCR
jgi:two-component system cell cycle response regulator DivK